MKVRSSSAAGGVGREERRLREALLEMLEDARRVVQDEVAVDEHGHELLAADRHDRAAIVGIDVDPLDAHPLVRERQRDPLHVRREGDPVERQAHAGTIRVAARGS